MDYKIKNITKHYGKLKVLDNISFDIPHNKIIGILGPSGCGKTTLLNIISNLDNDYTGKIEGLSKNSSSCVFQEDRLLPWLNAIQNVSFVLNHIKNKKEKEQIAIEVLSKLGLQQNLYMKPNEMSGGMKRRVSLARAFAFPSEIILLDEPFSSLDIKTRISVMTTFNEYRKIDKRSAIIVTHDVREALFLSDEIYVLSNKPSSIIYKAAIQLSSEQRNYTSPASAELEAGLYKAILSE